MSSSIAARPRPGSGPSGSARRAGSPLRSRADGRSTRPVAGREARTAYQGPLTVPSLRISGRTVPAVLGVPSENALARGMVELVESGALVARDLGHQVLSEVSIAEGSAAAAAVPATVPAAVPVSVGLDEIERQLCAGSQNPGFDPLILIAAEALDRYETGTPQPWSEDADIGRWKRTYAAPWAVEKRPCVVYASAYCPWVCDPRATLRAIEAAFDEGVAAAVLATVAHAVEPLVPAWGPEDTLYVIQSYRWHGEEDDREMLDDLRYQIAHHRGVEHTEVSDEDVVAEAEGYYWTTDYVRSRIPKVWSSAKPLSPREAYSLAAEARRRRTEGDEADVPGLALIEVLLTRAVRCRRVCAALALGYPIQDTSDEYMSPFGVVLDIDAGDEPLPHQDSIVVETFEEQARHEAETGGDPAPLVGMGFDPNRPDDVARLRVFLRHVAAAEEACLHLLRPLCPGDLDQARTEPERKAGRQIRGFADSVDPQYREPSVRAGSSAARSFATTRGFPAALPAEAVMLL